MTTFDDREHAFEAHFAFEEEQDFMVKARRDRLAAEWAAGLMQLKPEQTEAYVLSVVRADLALPNTEEVYTKLLADLAGAGVSIRPEEVRAQIMKLTAEAREQVAGEQTG
jgi:hypothetical protein